MSVISSQSLGTGGFTMMPTVDETTGGGVDNSSAQHIVQNGSSIHNKSNIDTLLKNGGIKTNDLMSDTTSNCRPSLIRRLCSMNSSCSSSSAVRYQNESMVSRNDNIINNSSRHKVNFNEQQRIRVDTSSTAASAKNSNESQQNAESATTLERQQGNAVQQSNRQHNQLIEEEEQSTTIQTLSIIGDKNMKLPESLSEQWLGGEPNKFNPIEELQGINEIWNRLTIDERVTIYTTDTTIPIRHYRAEKQNVQKAVLQIKETLVWRKEFGVDDIKKCWGKLEEDSDHDDDDTASHLKELRTRMGIENATGKIYVRGYDKDGRALMYMTPALENCAFHLENNMKHLVWNLEKAIACTKRKSMEIHERIYDKINLLIDYDGFRLSNAPPLSITRYTLDILQKHYPERMYHAYLLSPPAVFCVFWSCIKSFVDDNTKEKIVFCTGTDGLQLLVQNVTAKHKLEIRSGYTPLVALQNSSTIRSTSAMISVTEAVTSAGPLTGRSYASEEMIFTNSKSIAFLSTTCTGKTGNSSVRPFDSPTYQLLPIDVSFDEDKF